MCKYFEPEPVVPEDCPLIGGGQCPATCELLTETDDEEDE